MFSNWTFYFKIRRTSHIALKMFGLRIRRKRFFSKSWNSRLQKKPSPVVNIGAMGREKVCWMSYVILHIEKCNNLKRGEVKSHHSSNSGNFLRSNRRWISRTIRRILQKENKSRNFSDFGLVYFKATKWDRHLVFSLLKWCSSSTRYKL